MRWLICGAGSIGLQHLIALKALGEHDLQIVEPNLERRKAAWEYVGKRHAHGALEEAGAYDVAIVATPTALHVDHAKAVLEAGAHVIIEKPVSHERERKDELFAAAKKKIVAVSCPLRFHPLFIQCCKGIDGGHLGKVHFARMWYRQDMKTWRPGRDYRDTYSAHKDQGGGLLLDRIHEFDAARVLFGFPNRIVASLAGTSNLETDTEHMAGVLAQHGGMFVSTELDCVSPGYHSGIYIVGSKAQIMEPWSLEGWKIGQSDQVKHWIACMHGTEEPMQKLADAYTALNIVLAAYFSAQQGEWVTMQAKASEPAPPVDATGTASLAA